VIALGVVSFFTDLSSEMIYPLLPLFLVGTLGAGAVAIGTIEGLAESTASVLKVLSGRWTDRTHRRKPLIVSGYGLSGAARPLIGAAAVWPVVAFLRFADRVGKGLRTSPRDALIADVTHPNRLGAAFGLHRAMDHAGAVAGPLVAAGLLLIPSMTLRGVFLLAAIPAGIVMVVLASVREPVRPLERAGGIQTSLLHDWSAMGVDFRRLLLAVLVFTLGNSTDAFLLLRLSETGLGAGSIALLWAAHHAVKMIATFVGGRVSDRMGRRRSVMAGWVVYAAVYFAFAVVSSPVGLIVVFLSYGMYFGLTEPVERAWVAGLAPARLRGNAFGLYHGAIGLAALPASVVFGAVYAAAGSAAAFTTGAVLAGVATILLRRVPEPHRDTVIL
jgi:MFS family permease